MQIFELFAGGPITTPVSGNTMRRLSCAKFRVLLVNKNQGNTLDWGQDIGEAEIGNQLGKAIGLDSSKMQMKSLFRLANLDGAWSPLITMTLINSHHRFQFSDEVIAHVV
jgi:hypothetical protein